jgi:hypothetical protein
MLSISAICAARSAPMARPVRSLGSGKAAPVPVVNPAGEGVAGTPPPNMFDGRGAVGAAGVDAVAAGAGVEGALEADEAGAGDAAGAVFG